MRIAAKIDSNQNDIVAALRKVGAIVIITSQLKNLFDIIICWRGNVWLCEIKDGAKPPSKQALTPGEIDCKEKLESVEVKYNVINSVDSALRLVGAIQ